MTLLLGDVDTFDDSGTTFTDSGFANDEIVTKRIALASGFVDTIELLTVGDTGDVWLSLHLSIYADDGGYPGALLGYGTVADNPGTANGIRHWVSATGLAVPVVEGTYYWLGVMPIDDGVAFEDAPGVSYDTWFAQFDPSFPTTPDDPFPPITGDFDTDPVNIPKGVGIRALAVADEATPIRGLEWHVTGLWYPEAESVAYYGQISDPIDGSVTIPLNDSRTAEVTVSAWDPIVNDLVGHAYARHLKVYYHGSLVFWGPYKLGEVKDDEDGNPTVTLNAVDPSLRVIRHFLRRGDIGGSLGVGGDLNAANDDKATVTIDGDGMRLVLDSARSIASQIARGAPDIGIDAGTDTFTPAPDALMSVARGDQTWSTMVQMSESLGPDFELHPTEDIVGSYCTLNTYDSQGTDKSSSVQLHYAKGLDNLDNLSFTEGSKYTTHVHAQSRDGLVASVAAVAASGVTGQYTDWEPVDYDGAHIDPDKVEAVLQSFGVDVLKAYGRPLLVLTARMPLDSDDGYLYLRDYAVGDSVGVAGKWGLIDLEEAPYRIVQVTLAQDGPDNAVRPELQIVADRVAAAGDSVGAEDG